jgi:hypothetical protein
MHEIIVMNGVIERIDEIDEYLRTETELYLNGGLYKRLEALGWINNGEYAPVEGLDIAIPVYEKNVGKGYKVSVYTGLQFDDGTFLVDISDISDEGVINNVRSAIQEVANIMDEITEKFVMEP